ncbi:MAG: transporter permease [Nonomuraea muscovyensis]|nr:transporter permease [Nonomuraea muscovyensis]
MTLPMKLLSTFDSPRFVTYMGAPESDLRADLQFSDDIDAVREDVLSSMQGDERLTDVTIEVMDALTDVHSEEATPSPRSPSACRCG